MKGNATALENLAHEFYWVPSFLAWIGDRITDLGPIIALAGAIYIYFRKSEDERKEIRRDERRKVYAEYLHQCGLLWNEVSAGPTSSNISRQTSDLKRYGEELRLLAPEDVYVKAFNVRAVYVEYGSHVLSLTPQQWLNKTEEHRNADSYFIEKLTASTDELICSMQDDLCK